MKSVKLISTIMVSVLLLMCSCTRLNGSNAIESKESFDGVFKMLEMVQSDNGGVVFAVRECDAPYDEILLFTSRYSYAHGAEAYWANNNNDFFILSHDVGVIPYIFKSNTWESGYIIRITESAQGKGSADLIKLLDNTSVEYDYDNIPKEIIEYLINRNN